MKWFRKTSETARKPITVIISRKTCTKYKVQVYIGSISTTIESIRKDGVPQPITTIQSAALAATYVINEHMYIHQNLDTLDTPQWHFLDDPESFAYTRALKDHEKRSQKHALSENITDTIVFKRVPNEDAQPGDIVTLESTDGYALPLIRVTSDKNGILYHMTQSFSGLPEGKWTTSQLRDMGWRPSRTSRRTVIEDDFKNYQPHPEELGYDRAPLPGTLASLYLARQYSKAVVDHWENRMQDGEVLDEYALDDLNSARRAQQCLEELIVSRTC